jgi:hypothetical protein
MFSLNGMCIKNAVSWDITQCGSCKNRRFGGLSSSIIRVARISEIGTTLAVNWQPMHRLRLTLFLVHWFSSHWWWRRYIPPKRRFLQEPHGVTSQKTVFFVVTVVKTSNLTWHVFRLEEITVCWMHQKSNNNKFKWAVNWFLLFSTIW